MLFRTLSMMLKDSEKLVLSIEKKGETRLRVMIEPLLRDMPDVNEDDDMAQLRAALSLPLRLEAEDGELDTDFIESVRQYHEARVGVTESLSVLTELREAAKLGKKAVQEKARKGASQHHEDDARDEAGKQEDAKVVNKPVTPPPAPVSNPMNLFGENV